MNNVFPSTHPLVAHKLALLRDKNTEPKKFRELIPEIAALLTYEATADLSLRPDYCRHASGPGNWRNFRSQDRSGANPAGGVRHGGRRLESHALCRSLAYWSVPG